MFLYSYDDQLPREEMKLEEIGVNVGSGNKNTNYKTSKLSLTKKMNATGMNWTTSQKMNQPWDSTQYTTTLTNLN